MVLFPVTDFIVMNGMRRCRMMNDMGNGIVMNNVGYCIMVNSYVIINN